jgi:hypothetical protein
MRVFERLWVPSFGFRGWSQMSIAPALRVVLLVGVATACVRGWGQAPPATPDPASPQVTPQAVTPPVPDAPQASTSKPLNSRPALPADKQAIEDQKRAAEQLRISKLAIINGRPYDQPSTKDTVLYYLNDSYLLPALAGTTVRALYSQARGKPEGWGTDFPGFMQRFGSAYAITAIDGNVRLGMELLFHEDLRYIPCHGCSAKKKIKNALLSEVTARHDVDGHRFFTLTPEIADFSGPIIAHSLWYPNGFDPFGGVVQTRTVVAVRVGMHLFTEFVLERRHKDKKIED